MQYTLYRLSPPGTSDGSERRPSRGAQHTTHSTLHTAHYTQHTTHRRLHKLHFTNCTLHTMNTAHTAHFTHCTLNTLHTTHNAHCTSFTLHALHTAHTADTARTAHCTAFTQCTKHTPHRGHCPPQAPVYRYLKLRPPSFVPNREEVVNDIRKTLSGAILDPEDKIQVPPAASRSHALCPGRP